MLLSFSKAMQRYELFPNLQTFDKKNYRKSMFFVNSCCLYLIYLITYSVFFSVVACLNRVMGCWLLLFLMGNFGLLISRNAEFAKIGLFADQNKKRT